MVNTQAWKNLKEELRLKNVTLIAVSKTQSAADIQTLYDLGQKDFGENYVQELTEKQHQLPAGVRWHFIGHLQSNKVKAIAPFIHLIHTVDSFRLLREINKQAASNNRTIDVLLQLRIAAEETKFGLDEKEMEHLLDEYQKQVKNLTNIRICGLMGMATNTNDEQQIHNEFSRLHDFYKKLANTVFINKPEFSICSIGMSADYKIAVAEGGNMVRIGSLLFGARL